MPRVTLPWWGARKNKWLVRDEFLTDLAAESFENSRCEPGPGFRSETTSGLDCYISESKLVFGGITTSIVLLYQYALPRVPGTVIFAGLEADDVTSSISVGFIQPPTTTSDAFRILNDIAYPRSDGVNGSTFFVPVDNTFYIVAVVLLSTGAAYYVKVGETWTYYGTYGTSTLTPIFPYVAGTNASATVSFVRVRRGASTSEMDGTTLDRLMGSVLSEDIIGYGGFWFDDADNSALIALL